MAITIYENRPMGYKEFYGLSTDEKPAQDVAVNSLFLELDTKDFYYFDGNQWAKVGGGAEPTGELLSV